MPFQQATACESGFCSLLFRSCWRGGVFTVLRQFDLVVPWWLDMPSVLGVFGLVLLAYDRWIWAFRLARMAGCSGPNLNGRWSGVLSSSFDRGATEFPVTVDIAQTWSHLSIALVAQTSRSRSSSAALELTPEGSWALSYTFLNEPIANAPKRMHAHRGTAVVRLEGEGSLEGEYYSGRDRRGFGMMSLRREALSPGPPVRANS